MRFRAAGSKPAVSTKFHHQRRRRAAFLTAGDYPVMNACAPRWPVWTRTRNLRINNPPLCQLSYRPLAGMRCAHSPKGERVFKDWNPMGATPDDRCRTLSVDSPSCHRRFRPCPHWHACRCALHMLMTLAAGRSFAYPISRTRKAPLLGGGGVSCAKPRSPLPLRTCLSGNAG